VFHKSLSDVVNKWEISPKGFENVKKKERKKERKKEKADCFNYRPAKLGTIVIALKPLQLHVLMPRCQHPSITVIP
jgi:hypothetical protein